LDYSKQVHEFDPDNEDKSSFRLEVNKNENGQVAGSSVYAKVNIPKGSYIMPDHLSRSMVLNEKSIEGIRGSIGKSAPAYDEFFKFIEDNAHSDHMEGNGSRYLEVGATTLMRRVDNPEEANVGRWMPAHPGKRPIFSPVYDRHRMSFDLFMVATKDIPAGAEVTRTDSMWTHDM
jgi:hypothetical protein